jgi:hypothetical protein
MKLAAKIVAMLVVGTALGLFVTWLTIFHRTMPGGISDGPWKTNLLIGSSGGDMATRAAVAVHGLLALNRSETIYFTASQDSGGNALDGRCSYLVAGRDPPTRWWSITVYGADDYLIPNAANRYSISKTSVVRDAGGAFTAPLGPDPHGANALPTGGRRFTLTLRLYNPAASVAADPARVALPSIRKVSCP